MLDTDLRGAEPQSVVDDDVLVLVLEGPPVRSEALARAKRRLAEGPCDVADLAASIEAGHRLLGQGGYHDTIDVRSSDDQRGVPLPDDRPGE